MAISHRVLWCIIRMQPTKGFKNTLKFAVFFGSVIFANIVRKN